MMWLSTGLKWVWSLLKRTPTAISFVLVFLAALAYYLRRQWSAETLRKNLKTEQLKAEIEYADTLGEREKLTEEKRVELKVKHAERLSDLRFKEKELYEASKEGPVGIAKRWNSYITGSKKPSTLPKDVLVAILCTSLIMAPGSAYAGPPCTEAREVTTPCSGVLLPVESAEDGLRCLTVTIPSMESRLEYVEESCGLEKSHLKETIELERVRVEEYRSLLDKSLDTVQEDPWYTHPVFWTAVGFVLGTSLTVGVVYDLPD